jgi:hypothetical protein
MITNAQLAVGVAQLAADFKAGTITQAAHAAGLTALYDNWNQQISVGGLAKRVSEQITRFDSKFSSFLDLTVKGSKALVVDLPLTGVTGDLWWVLQAASGLPFGQAYIWIIDAWFPQGDRLTQGQTGAGVPPGGTTGQIATKGSSADYDIDWVDAGAGGTAIWGVITGTPAFQPRRPPPAPPTPPSSPPVPSSFSRPTRQQPAPPLPASRLLRPPPSTPAPPSWRPAPSSSTRPIQSWLGPPSLAFRLRRPPPSTPAPLSLRPAPSSSTRPTRNWLGPPSPASRLRRPPPLTTTPPSWRRRPTSIGRP